VGGTVKARIPSSEGIASVALWQQLSAFGPNTTVATVPWYGRDGTGPFFGRDGTNKRTCTVATVLWYRNCGIEVVSAEDN
jgi:hypothetical protein